MTRDEIRTAGLLFGEELALGLIEPEALQTPEVKDAVRSHPVPSALSRRLQRLQMKRGRLTYAAHSVAPMMAARRAVLGDAAAGRPKVLVRVDQFPHPEAWDETARYGTEDAARFHRTMVASGAPYLMAVTPRVARNPLDPDGTEWREHDEGERELLAEMRRDGVSFAVHGLDHRTRHAKARRHSEFTGRARKDVEERLETAQQAMRDRALHADVFVPPYDRFSASTWSAVASRFDVVCGGPESVTQMGFRPTPTWRGDAVWLPAYAPLYGTAEEVLPAIKELADEETGLWIPVVLRWSAEADTDWEALERLADVLGAGEFARPWDDFLLAAGASRHASAALDQRRGRG